ncbi:hypothetical protein PIB30_060267 [Stylosanthes scabra]|uniref:Thioredoxin domain-containing protein n=1 Tax=Stylosanthes scabra TaxID=79078 RepID=A0ABU6SKG8_9FABA|nr:hypothetical protein [Stylosanthes scabra]
MYVVRCGHYKKLAPEYEKLAATFKKTNSVLIAKVDCDEEKTICSKYGVSGYPTIKWFPQGSLEPIFIATCDWDLKRRIQNINMDDDDEIVSETPVQASGSVDSGNKSNVWKFFKKIGKDRDGVEKASCNFCNREYSTGRNPKLIIVMGLLI